MENAQSDKIIKTHNIGKTVSTSSIVSDSDSTFAKKPSPKLKLKALRKRKSKLRKRNKMKADKAVEAVVEENKMTAVQTRTT